MEKKIKMNLEENVDASEIARFVQVANQFSGTVYIEVENVGRINAKSIMGMMSLGLDNGEQLEVSADGADEQAAVAGIENFLEGRKGA